MIKAEWTNADALNLQPTCNQLATDCISRQAAIDAVKDLLDSMIETDTIGFYEIEHALFEVPSAQQWTPVQQNPKRSDWYIVTKRFGNDGELWIGAKWYSTAYGWTGDGVLAWMELPEAYKEGE